MIAQFELSELEHLEEILGNLDLTPIYGEDSTANPLAACSDVPLEHSGSSTTAGAPSLHVSSHDALPFALPGGGVLDENYFGTEFSAAQIMDTVNSINCDHTDWMSQTVLEHSIW